MTSSRAILLLVFGVFLGPSRAIAQRPIDVRVIAEVAAERDVVEGRCTVAIDLPEGTDEVRLWLLPARLEEVPHAMDLRTARYVFPRGRDLGTFAVSDVRIDGEPARTRREGAPAGSAPSGRDAAGDDLVVSVERGPARVITVSLAFRLEVPRRFGRFARVGERLYLTGPWYPLVLGPEGEYRFDAPHHVEVALRGEGDVFAAGRRHGPRAEVSARGAYVPIAVADRFRAVAVWEGDTLIRLWSHRDLPRHPPPDARGEASLRDLSVVDVPAQVMRVARSSLRTLALASSFDPPRALEMLWVPSRVELAEAAPGLVLVADRIYQVSPIRNVRAFHDRALRRAIFRRAVAGFVDRVEPAADRDVAERLRATVLDDLDTRRREDRVRSPRELMNWASFHPAVDQLLYAPQVAFPQAYFDGGEEPFREAPDVARRQRASGPRLLALLRDSLGAERFDRLVRRWLDEPVAVRRTIEEADPAIAALLDEWIAAPEHPLNYRLGAVRSRRLPSGRYEHTITVHRDGDDRREPVEVRVRDRDGNEACATWDAAGHEGTVVVETPAARRNVVVDPDVRRVQSAELVRDHPRRDDAERLPLRPPLARSFALGLNATERRLTGFIDLAFRRRYDLSNSFGVLLATGPRNTGGTGSYTRFVGRARDTNNRIGFVSTGLGLDRIDDEFTDMGVGGLRTSLVLGAGYNTKSFSFDPRDGSSVLAYVRGAATHRDDGSLGLSLTPSIRTNVTLPVGLRGAFIWVSSLSWIFGDPLPGERPGLGGPFHLRGYLTNEIVADGAAFTVVEQRFTPFSDLAFDAIHLAWIREIQLALFAGAGAAFDATDGRDRVVAADVGGGLRVHFDYFGIQPGLFAIDVGVPLIREAAYQRDLAPVTVVVGFDQFF